MKSLKHYILVIAISFLPFISIFATPLAPHTHDSPVHFARIAAYYKALTDGQLLPRWAGELNYGYGMPLFNFIYHVPYLITSIPVAFGAGLVFSFKFALLVSFLLSGVFMYFFALRFFKHEGRAFITTMLYQFAPFHLVDLVVRGDMAEGYALAFIPLVLYTITRSFEEKNTAKNIVFIGFATLLLIISHNAISLVFFGVAALFTLVFAPDNKKRVSALMGLALGLGLAAFYWLPALVERKFTYGDLFMKDMYKSHFAPIQHFFIPNFTNNEAFLTGGIAVTLGLMQVVALISALYFLFKKKIIGINKTLAWFALFLTIMALFVMQPVSQFFWSNIPILRMFQFPWRLLNVTTLSLALLGGTVLVWKKIPLRWLVSISLLCVISVSVYFRPPLGFDPIDEKYFWDYPLNTTYFGETDVIWSAGPAGSYPEKRFELASGTGTITNTSKKNTVHTFTVHAETDVQVVDRTQYFPGWRVYNNGQKLPIEFQDQNWRGLITFSLPKGTHAIRVAWEESAIRQIAEGVTIISMVGMIGLLFLSRGRKQHA